MMAEPQGDDLMQKLSALLQSMTDRQLSSIGVTLDRDNSKLLQMKEFFVEALYAEGRCRAAKSLAQHDLLFSSYAIALTAGLLRQLDRILAQKYSAPEEAE